MQANLENYNLDPTLNWKKAEITEINENYLVLKYFQFQFL